MRSFWDIIKPPQLRVRTILLGLVLYLLFLWIGVGMISEYQKYGYYIDYKHWLKLSGDGAKIAGYGVTCVAALGLLYNLYLLAVAILRKTKKDRT